MLDATRLSRRSFGAVLAATGVAVLVGCGDVVEAPENAAIDEAAKAEDLVLVLLATARRDVADLTAGAEQAGDGAKASLTRAARMRTVHAERLVAEAERIGLDASPKAESGAGEDVGAGGADDDGTENPGADRSESAPVPLDLENARQRLQAAATEAGDVAVRSRDYRAELTASIAAACTACAEVVLS